MMGRWYMLGLLVWRYISTAQYIAWDTDHLSLKDAYAIGEARYMREHFGMLRFLIDVVYVHKDGTHLTNKLK